MLFVAPLLRVLVNSTAWSLSFVHVVWCMETSLLKIHVQIPVGFFITLRLTCIHVPFAGCCDHHTHFTTKWTHSEDTQMFPKLSWNAAKKNLLALINCADDEQSLECNKRMLNTEQQTKTHFISVWYKCVTMSGWDQWPCFSDKRTAGTLKTSNLIDEGSIVAQCFTINCAVRKKSYMEM